jgi:hypothetical protein
MTDIITQSGLDITLVAMDANGHLSDKQKEPWDRIKSIAQKTCGTITDASQPEKPIMHPPISISTPTVTEMNPRFFSIVPSFLRHKIFLSIGGGLSFIALLCAFKYYYENNATEK